MRIARSVAVPAGTAGITYSPALLVVAPRVSPLAGTWTPGIPVWVSESRTVPRTVPVCWAAAGANATAERSVAASAVLQVRRDSLMVYLREKARTSNRCYSPITAGGWNSVAGKSSLGRTGIEGAAGGKDVQPDR